MKNMTRVVFQSLFYFFLIISFLLLIFYHFCYVPALSSYSKIDENLIGTIFNLASVTASCEGMKALPENRKSDIPYFQQSLIHDHMELKKSQTGLYTSIQLAEPYLDKITIQKLEDFLNWSQNQENKRIMHNICPEIKTSYDSLMEKRDSLMKAVPFRFKDYLIFYIRKIWLKSKE